MLIDAFGASAPRAVLWDLDGTLVESSRQHYEAWRETLAAEGRPLSRELFVTTFGQRNDLVLRRFFGPDLPAAEVDRIAQAKEACYRALVLADGISFLPGAEQWLSTLREAGWRQALATSAPRANVDAVLAVLDARHHFAAIVAAEDVLHGKPDPEVFQLAAHRLEVTDRRCVVVEDAPAGVEAARRAGMAVIGIGAAARRAGPTFGSDNLTGLPGDLFERLIGESAGRTPGELSGTQERWYNEPTESPKLEDET